jgi:hypothetical protein
MNAFGKKSSTLLFVLIVALTSYSQKSWEKYQFGLTGGVFIYQGDLSPSPIGSYRTPALNLNLFANRLIGPALAIRANLSWGHLRGDDAAYSNPEWRQQRAFNFSARVLEFSGLAVWYPRGNDRRFAPYIFGGAGLGLFKINRDWTRFNSEYFNAEPTIHDGLSQDLAHKLPRLVPVLPVGAGFQYDISTKWALVAETAYRFSRTDYLDGFSKAANPNLMDHYLNHSIGILYKPGKRSTLDCPPSPAATY